MPRSFSFLLSVVIGLLALLAITFSLLTYNQGPRLEHASLDTSGLNPVMSIDLTEPLGEGQNISHFISLSPNASMTLSQLASQLIIRFNQNLEASTSYKLTIRPGLKNTRGTTSKTAFTTTFVTSNASFVYVRRDNACESLVSNQVCNDQVIKQSPGLSSQTILTTASHIKDIAVSRQYLVVLRGVSPTSDQLYAINLSNGHKTILPVNDHVVLQIGISSLNPVVGFIAAHAGSSTGRLYTYDLASHKLNSINLPETAAAHIRSFIFSHDGQSLLYQDSNKIFYVTSPTVSNYKPSIIGVYANVNSFNYLDNQILFQDSYGNYYTYNSLTRSSQVSPLTALVQAAPFQIIQAVFAATNNNYLAVEYDPYDPSLSTSQPIDQVSLPGVLELYTANQVNDFDFSPDGRYVLLQTYADNETYSDPLYNNFTQPIDSVVALYDTTTKQLVKQQPGVEPLWLP